MKSHLAKRALLALAIMAGTCGANGIAADTPAPKPAPKLSLATIAWLAGAWAFERNGRVVEEQWLAPAGGTMIGLGRTVADGKTVEYEFLRIHEEAGEILYTAHPSGQAEASFTLRRASEWEVVFENLGHDFPQRIIYSIQPDGSLLAAIEGKENGKDRRVVFPYHRAKP